jgi:hypothetical protein
MSRLRGWPLSIAACVLLLAACVAGPNPLVEQASAGFWRGLWQGLISPITFVISLLADGVAVYEVHNNGHWYDFGFGLGVLFALSGTGRAAARGARSR